MSQGSIANMFQVERRKFYTSVTGKKYDTGKKMTKLEKFEKEQKEAAEKTCQTKGQPTKQQKQEKQEVAPPDDEDKVLYGNTDDDDSLPDLFKSQDTKKLKR